MAPAKFVLNHDPDSVSGVVFREKVFDELASLREQIEEIKSIVQTTPKAPSSYLCFTIYIIIFLALFIFTIVTPDSLETPMLKKAEPSHVAQADLNIPVDMLSKDNDHPSSRHLSADGPRSILFPQVPCSSPAPTSASQHSENQDSISGQHFYNAIFMIRKSLEALDVKGQSVEPKPSKLNTPEMTHLSARMYHLAIEWLVKMGDEGPDIKAVKDKINTAHMRKHTEPEDGAKRENTNEAKPITTAGEEEYIPAKPLAAITKQKEEEEKDPTAPIQAQAQDEVQDTDMIRTPLSWPRETYESWRASWPWQWPTWVEAVNWAHAFWLELVQLVVKRWKDRKEEEGLEELITKVRSRWREVRRI